jgi:ATP-dependent RNA helicase DDX18/HAS1
MLSENLKSISSTSTQQKQQCWTFRPFITTAAGSRVTNIRDQIRLLQSTTIDVLISTPGRLSTILRTHNSGLDLSDVMSLVLDEVDFLLVDESFSPQLRAVGAAVRRNDDDNDGNDDIDDGEENTKSIMTGTRSKGTQFIFVIATLPTDVLDVIRAEVPNITELRGPGLHRITPTVTQTLVDVSVPSSMNRNIKAGFDIKVRELHKALRSRRVDRTLVFCNTVETCRDVENALKRNDRSGRRSRVWAYHNALSPENRLKNLHSFSSTSSSREEYDKSSRGGDSSSSSGSSSSSSGSGIYAESVLVCTDRAARGVDFESNPVDHVILFDFPKDPAEYVRRVGRTARAGRAGASTVLAYGWQLPIARQIMGLGGGGSSSSSSGGGGGSDNTKKKGKGKRGNAKLEGFNMMKSDDGWDDELNDTKDEDEYFVKGGARKRKEQGSVTTSSSTTPNKNGGAISSKEKGKRTKSTDDGIGKSR